MMDAFDLASRLFGNSRAESRGDVSNSLDILTATGAGDSSDGAATVYLDADVTPADDYDGDDYAIGIPTSPNVIEGDGVLVGLTGSGPLKTPVVISNPGSGDRMQVQVDNAETLAEQADAVATATGQHFWHDTDGAHVTEAAREDWETTHTGANSIWNSLGMLFRDGLNNLLAVLTSGIAIYDGNGNAASNILAEFTANLVRIGGRLLGTGTSTASVQFFQSDASQTDIKATHTVGSTTPPTGPDDVYGIVHNVRITTTTDGSELPQLAGVSGWAQLDMDAEVNPDYWAGSAILRARVGDDDEFGDGTPQLGVIRQVATNGLEGAEIYMAAPTLALNDNARYKAARVPMEQAINVLSSPVTLFTGTYSQTVSSTVTLSETAANFSRMLIEWETADGNQGSTMLSNPNGKRFECVAVNCGANANPITYIKWKVFRVNGTQISNYSVDGTQAQLQRGEIALRNNGSTTTTRNEYIGITKVLGWR